MKIIFLSFSLFFFIACTDTTKIPEGILPKKKMEAVLWDIIQAERYSTLFLTKDSASKNIQLEKFRLYGHVFDIHKVSKDDFIRSYKFYLSRPDIAKVIFDSISVKADRQREQRYKQPTPVQ